MQNFLDKYISSGLAWLWLSYVVVMIDQLTKYFVKSSILLSNSEVINAFFEIRYVENKGAAFSFLADGHTWQYLFLISTNTIILFFLLSMLFKSTFDRYHYNVAIALIIAGAIGNLVDRVRFGAVIDFFDFHINSYHWPTFNVADVAICFGAFLLMLATRKQHQ